MLESAVQVPGVGVERVGENLLDVGRNRPVVGGDDAAAAVAVARVVQQVQIFAAGFHVVPAGCVEEHREVVAERVRRSDRDNAGRLLLRPVWKPLNVMFGPSVEMPLGACQCCDHDGQTLLLDSVGGITGSELVQRSIAEHLRELADDVGRYALRWRWSPDGWFAFPGPNGSCRIVWFTFPIRRVFDENS